jgi:RNase H-like domain found in reverse transcriptase/Reverse transcriptase (RNA-dependent DNA polymerase)
MGPKRSPSYFQHQMAFTVLAGLMYVICELYIDDLLIPGRTESEFLTNVRTVFERLRKHKITVKPSKCLFGVSSLEYVGHVIDSEGMTFHENKIRKVLKFDQPKYGKQLKSFLGLVNVFRDHIRQHSVIVRPLHKLLTNYDRTRRLVWTPEAEIAFNVIQQQISDVQKLFFLNDTDPVFLQTDASDYGIGAYLFQRVNGIDIPIVFFSQALTEDQCRWSTLEKEAYAIIRAFEEFDYLIRDRFFTLQTDHKNLIFINSSGSAKVLRWKLSIQEYDFDIEHIEGKKNIVADGFC